MMDGTHTLAAQASWGVNVWITGSSKNNVTVNVTYTGTYPIYANGGTNTSQSISNITFTGNSKSALYCVGVYNRDNVEITNCDFTYFKYTAVNFWSDGSWRTGNKINNCTITDCASGKDDGSGDETYALKINYQTGFDCGYNTLDETTQTVQHAGIPIGGLEGCRGLKLHDNIVTAHYRQTISTVTYWTFAIEFWKLEGAEFYRNEFRGEVDMGSGVSRGSYAYGFYGYDNIFGYPTNPWTYSTVGLQFEQYAQGVILVRNTFRNTEQGLYFCNNWGAGVTDYVEDVYVMSNIFYGIGCDATNVGLGIRFENGENSDTYYPPTYYSNINIINNTMVGASGTYSMHYGIDLPTQGTVSGVTNVTVRNNIIMGFTTYPIVARRQDDDYTAAIDYLTITNNLCYSNGNSNNTYISTSVTLTNATQETHIKSDPLFVSSTNFHLSSTSSPAYHAGTAFSFTYNTGDFENNDWYNPPSIGAYEYVEIPKSEGINMHPIKKVGAWMMKGGKRVVK